MARTVAGSPSLDLPQPLRRWAQRLAGGKVSLMLDNDDRGRDGAKATLWKLARQMPVLLADYAAVQTEHPSSAEMEAAYQSLLKRWTSG